MDVDISDEIEIEDWKPDIPIVNSNKNEIQLIQYENCENDGQKCHICDQFFQNLEAHFVSSHIKEENSNDENVIIDNQECKDFESVNIKKYQNIKNRKVDTNSKKNVENKLIN